MLAVSDPSIFSPRQLCFPILFLIYHSSHSVLFLKSAKTISEPLTLTVLLPIHSLVDLVAFLLTPFRSTVTCHLSKRASVTILMPALPSPAAVTLYPSSALFFSLVITTSCTYTFHIILFTVCPPNPPLECKLHKGRDFYLFCLLLHFQYLEECQEQYLAHDGQLTYIC